MHDSAQRISVVVADDHPVVLHGLAEILHAEPDIQVVSLCPNGAAAAQAIRIFEPDVAVLDMRMPHLDAFGVVRVVGAAIHTRFVFLTASASAEEARVALDSGAAGVLFKDASTEDLIKCIRAVTAGCRWSASEPRLEGAHAALDDGVDGDPARPLSAREFQVAKLVSRGLSNKEVGRLLSLSEGTVKIHLHKIYGKIGVPNRTALATLNSIRDNAPRSLAGRRLSQSDRRHAVRDSIVLAK